MLDLCVNVYIVVYCYLIFKICPKEDILYTSITEKLFNKNTKERKTMLKTANSKEVSTKLMKGLLDLIILQFLNTQPMHGYQIITKIRKNFGVYFGPSTIYPLLGMLEKKALVKSEWNMNSERPRKIYKLTINGQNTLSLTEESLNFISRKLTATNTSPAVGVHNEASADILENKARGAIPAIQR
jgi:PadR family transcriptional regulator PadR